MILFEKTGRSREFAVSFGGICCKRGFYLVSHIGSGAIVWSLT